MIFDPTIFCDHLKQLVENSKYSRVELCEKLHTSPPTLSRYLNHQRVPSADFLANVSDFFGVSCDWLIGLKENKYESLTSENYELISLYNLATEDDKLVIKTLLKKYKKD